MNAQRGPLCFLATLLLLAISLALPDLSAFEGSRCAIIPVSFSGSGAAPHHAGQAPPSSPFEGALRDNTERPLPLAVLDSRGFTFSPVSILQNPSPGKDKRQTSKSSDSGGMVANLYGLRVMHAAVAHYISLSLHHCPDKRDATGNGPDDPRAGPLA